MLRGNSCPGILGKQMRHIFFPNFYRESVKASSCSPWRISVCTFPPKMRGGPLLVGCCRKRVRGERGRDQTRTLLWKKTKSVFKNQNTSSREWMIFHASDITQLEFSSCRGAGGCCGTLLKYLIVRLSGSSLGLALFLYIFPASSETKQYWQTRLEWDVSLERSCYSVTLLIDWHRVSFLLSCFGLFFFSPLFGIIFKHQNTSRRPSCLLRTAFV